MDDGQMNQFKPVGLEESIASKHKEGTKYVLKNVFEKASCDYMFL